MKILVTGGAGFIGSAVVRRIVDEGRDTVINLDKLTYAANLDSLSSVADSPAYVLEKADICDGDALKSIFERHQPDTVMHLAAESHVDRSIDAPADFVQTNVVGTYRLLETALSYYEALSGERRERFRFHHVSTDEVFGSLGPGDPAFNPETPYAPRSPYSASKAASDHLALAWHHTYGLPVVLSNCSNNYGCFQFPEKLIPLVILNALEGKPLPVYGKGENVRDWLYVEDHAEALLLILREGVLGESYLVGGNAERRNIDVVTSICQLMDELAPRPDGSPHDGLIEFVADRPGHDMRYAIDSSKVRDELGWTPRVAFEEGLRQTVTWYLENRAWWEPIRQANYDGQRLGLARKEAS